MSSFFRHLRDNDSFKLENEKKISGLYQMVRILETTKGIWTNYWPSVSRLINKLSDEELPRSESDTAENLIDMEQE